MSAREPRPTAVSMTPVELELLNGAVRLQHTRVEALMVSLGVLS